MRLSLFDRFADNAPKLWEGDWTAFVRDVIGDKHRLFTGDKALSPSFSPAEFEPGCPRRKEYVLRVHALALDFDHVTRADLETIRAMARTYRSVLYSSYNHEFEGPDDVRIRLVFALDRPVEASEWDRFWSRLVADLPVAPDAKCSDRGRLYALPYTPHPERAILKCYHDGAPLSVATVLALPAVRAESAAAPVAHEGTVSQPVTVAELRELATRLKRQTRGPGAAEAQVRARWCEQIASGLPFAIEGSRHNTYLRITGLLERSFPHSNIDAIADLFWFSLRGMAGPDFDPEAEKLDIVRALRGARDRRLVEAAAAADEAREGAVHRIREAFCGERSEPYTAAEIEGFAKAAEVSAAGFKQRWIIAYPPSAYVFVNGEYRTPIPIDTLPFAVQRDFAPGLELAGQPSAAGLSLSKLTADGKLVAKTKDDLLRDYGTLARTCVASFAAERSYYDAVEQCFYEAITPLRKLEPAHDPAIDTWLRHLSGARYADLLLWLQEFANLDQPLTALYLEGPPSTGKSMLAAGLARLWTTKAGATSAADVTADFNEAIGSCPFVLADERLPPAWAGPEGLGRFREFIAARTRTLHRKYLSRIPLLGCIRVMFAANNLELIDARAQLTPNDRAAVLERIAHVEVSEAAARYLASLPSSVIDGWVDGDGIARHVLWLRQQGLATRQGRFGVAPIRTRLTDEMIASHPVNSAVAQWLLRFLMDSARLRTPPNASRPTYALVFNGKFLVNVQAFAAQTDWERYVSNPREVPSPRRLSKALVELSESKRYQRRAVNYYVIRLPALIAFADMLGFSEAEIETAIRDTPPLAA